jgi:hypothetical protein
MSYLLLSGQVGGRTTGALIKTVNNIQSDR